MNWVRTSVSRGSPYLPLNLVLILRAVLVRDLLTNEPGESTLTRVTRTIPARLLAVLLISLLIAALALLGPAGTADAASYPKYGQQGSAVRAVQNKLIAAGYLKAELNGGTYGPKTKAAIKRVQREVRPAR